VRTALGAAALGAAALVTACSAPAPSPPPAGTPAASPAAPAPLRYRYLTDASSEAQARRYGFNLVDLGPYRSLIDALPAGERALVWLGGYSPADCAFAATDEQVRRELAPLAGDPKVAGYYLADEADDALPAYGGHCPHVAAQVTARTRLVHRLAPGTFTYEVVTEPGNFAAFARATDVLGTDPYPCLVGRPCDWSLIPRYIAALDAAHVARYWGVLQAFSYERWRSPTPGERASMIRQWQQSRWQGEQVFAWHYAGWSLAGHPGLLAVLRALNSGRLDGGSRISPAGRSTAPMMAGDFFSG
jgi:hypothetical protein